MVQKTISISKSTYERLAVELGKLQMKTREPQSFDSTINHLIDVPNEVLSSLYNDVERHLSLALQPGTSPPNIIELVRTARDSLRANMWKMGWQGQF